jgi:hypothetical protein
VDVELASLVARAHGDSDASCPSPPRIDPESWLGLRRGGPHPVARESRVSVGFFRSLRSWSPTPVAIQRHDSAIPFGTSLIVLGVAATVAAGIFHCVVLRRLRRNQELVLTQWPLSITLAFLLSVVGLAALWGVVQR